jgi:hypothetical protein
MDTDRFAQRIDELLRDKELARRMGRRGLEMVNEKYEANSQIDALEKLLQRLVEERSHKTLVEEESNLAGRMGRTTSGVGGRLTDTCASALDRSHSAEPAAIL